MLAQKEHAALGAQVADSHSGSFRPQVLAALLNPAAPANAFARGAPSCAFAPSLPARTPDGGARRWPVCARLRPAVAGLRSVAAPPAPSAGSMQPRAHGGKSEKAPKTRVTSVEEFRRVIDEGLDVTELEVVGDTARTGMHPVLETLAQRRAEGSKPGQRMDKYKIALAIEGGGMRGCVSAGMASALIDAGLGDCFDEVYGSSAGSLVGAYWIANSFGMVQYGCSLYYDLLTGKNSNKFFIDKTRALTLLGYGYVRWFTPRKIKELLGFRQKGLPLLNLSYLLRSCVEDMRPLDWEGFAARQKLIPLHIVASDVVAKKAVDLTLQGGHWSNIREMTLAMSVSIYRSISIYCVWC